MLVESWSIELKNSCFGRRKIHPLRPPRLKVRFDPFALLDADFFAAIRSNTMFFTEKTMAPLKHASGFCVQWLVHPPDFPISTRTLFFSHQDYGDSWSTLSVCFLFLGASEPELEIVAERTATWASSDTEAHHPTVIEPEVTTEQKSDADSDPTTGAPTYNHWGHSQTEATTQVSVHCSLRLPSSPYYQGGAK